VAAALGVSGTLTQTDENNIARIVDALKDAARRISRQTIKAGAIGA
jgi:DNA-binding IclR family transcriptional regulator